MVAVWRGDWIVRALKHLDVAHDNNYTTEFTENAEDLPPPRSPWPPRCKSPVLRVDGRLYPFLCQRSQINPLVIVLHEYFEDLVLTHAGWEINPRNIADLLPNERFTDRGFV
jgi:hypothetical protein